MWVLCGRSTLGSAAAINCGGRWPRDSLRGRALLLAWLQIRYSLRCRNGIHARYASAGGPAARVRAASLSSTVYSFCFCGGRGTWGNQRVGHCQEELCEAKQWGGKTGEEHAAPFPPAGMAGGAPSPTTSAPPSGCSASPPSQVAGSHSPTAHPLQSTPHHTPTPWTWCPQTFVDLC